MPPVAEFGREVRLVDFTEGYTGGRTTSLRFNVIPGFFSIHCGLSYIQGIDDEPLGAAAGVSEFDVIEPPASAVLNDPRDWRAQVYGRMSSFVVSFAAFHGEMRGWFFLQVWS